MYDKTQSFFITQLNHPEFKKGVYTKISFYTEFFILNLFWIGNLWYDSNERPLDFMINWLHIVHGL